MERLKKRVAEEGTEEEVDENIIEKFEIEAG